MASPSRLPSIRRTGRPVSMIDNPKSRLGLDLSSDSSNGLPSKQAKRRSLLPTFNRKFSGEDTAQIKEEEDEDSAGSAASSAPGEPRKAMEEMDRKTMPPPSKLGRPTSVYIGSRLGTGPTTRSHARESSKGGDARADALAALEGSMSNAMPRTGPVIPQRTTSTRLPQTGAPRGLSRTASVKPKEPLHTRGSSKSNSATTTTGATEKRASVSKPSQPRPIDTSVRTRAPSVTSPASPASSTTSRQSSTQAKVNRRSQMLPPPRPTFNTFQQHYSPAKSALPKPPLPAGRHTRTQTTSEEVEIPLTFDITKQQTELLQLSLLHQSSLQTSLAYETSALRKLSKKQFKLRKEHETIHELELEHHRIANLIALDTWCPDPALLAENLQILSKVHTALAEPRYADVLSAFENWVENACPDPEEGNGEFLEPLSGDWHKSHTSLALRLRALQRDVEILPPAPGVPSSLETLVVACERLLDGMLRELEMMSKLEKTLLERERMRVEAEVKAIGPVDGAKAWRPVWQSVG